MAVRWRGVLSFFGRLWLKAFKGSLWMAFISILVSFVSLSRSQITDTFSSSGSGSGMAPDNITCPLNVSCTDLPRQCLDCDIAENCTYGQVLNVTCRPIDTVECNVS